MQSKTLQTLLIALLLLCSPLAAKGPQNSSDGVPSGRYTDADGSILISVNDLGQAEGFYARGDVFGEISGALVDGAIVGQWMQTAGERACSTDKRGYAHWGRIEISSTDDNQIDARFSVCDESGVEPAPWTLRRVKD